MKKYRISKPNITNEDRRAVLSVLRTDHLSLGPKLEEFEHAFAKKIGAKYACAVSSGTAGLHLSMIAAGIEPGDEVITTPFSFIASANCVLYVGAKPIFVDIEPTTYNIDFKKIERKITKKTKAILVVHIFGQPANMGPILKIAKKYRLKVIEDACESIGAKYKGKTVGTFGESAVFAFYPNKQITTGEGGMIVTPSRKLHKLFLSLRNQGRAENMQWLDHQRLGFNYRMDEMSAALGLAQLKKLDYLIDQRRSIANLYNKYLADYGSLIKLPQIAENNVHTWFVYVIGLKNPKIPRDEIIDRLMGQGISTKPYLPSIHLFDFYRKKFGYKKGDFPVSEMVSESSLALPFYIGLREADIKYISNKVISILTHYDQKL